MSEATWVEVQKCNFPHARRSGVTCALGKGHLGRHSDFSPVLDGSGNIKIFEWDDKSEEPLPEQGQIFEVDYRSPAEVLESVKQHLISEAKLILPDDTVFEIRAKMYPNPYDRWACEKWGIAWYYSSQLQRYLDTDMCDYEVKKGAYDMNDGYILIARLKT